MITNKVMIMIIMLMVITVWSVNGDYDADGWIITSCNMMKGESVSQFNPCICESSFNAVESQFIKG